MVMSNATEKGNALILTLEGEKLTREPASTRELKHTAARWDCKKAASMHDLPVNRTSCGPAPASASCHGVVSLSWLICVLSNLDHPGPYPQSCYLAP